MRKAILGGSLFVVVLAGIGIWFWSLGSIQYPDTEEIVLTVTKPGVEVRSQHGEWQAVTGDKTLQATDEVRTDQTGRATVRFFGISETRLHEDSQIALEEARQEAEQRTTIVQFSLVSGRIWSRVLRLLDIDSSFTVHTSAVAATVRGTAFDLAVDATGTSMWVSDSAVHMQGGARVSLQDKGMMVPERSMARLNTNGTHSMRAMDTEEFNTEWFTQNHQADNDFDQAWRERLRARLEYNRPARAGSWSDQLYKRSEEVHLRFSKKDAPELYGLYIRRRLFGILSLFEQEKSGLGLQALMGLENDLKELQKSPDKKDYVPVVRSVIAEYMLLLSDVGPASPLYRFEQRLEDLGQVLMTDDNAARYYSRLLSLDARLTGVKASIGAMALEEAGISLDGTRQGIENIQRDLDQISPTIDGQHADRLYDKLAALRVREQALRTLLQAALLPPPATVLPLEAVTSTPAVIDLPSPTAPSSTPPASVPLVRLVVSAQPNPVVMGETSTLRVTGIDANGAEQDLTAKAMWNVYGQLGSLKEAVFTPSQAGSVTIEAVVQDGEVVKKAQTVLQIKEAVKLSQLEIIPQGSTTVHSGQTLPLVVKASYTGGSTRLVTAQVQWGTSDANVGSVTNGIFTAWINGYGTATVTASYTDGGVTKTASLPVMVVPNTSTQ